MKIKEIIAELENFAPLELSETWDNTGWQIKLDLEETEKVLLALSPTLDVIEQAKAQGCNLIITHHPLFFSKITRITPSLYSNKIAIEAIRNDIQIYCAHTNLDKTEGGINDKLAEILGLQDIQTQGAFVRTGEIKEIELENFIKIVKSKLSCDKIKLINPLGITTVKKVAVCSGIGGEFINAINADIFITGDVKYHSALEILDKAVLDAGHFETERVILPVLKELLAPCEIIIANEQRPWVII